MQHLGRRPEGKGRLCPCRLPFGGVRLSRIIELNHMFLRLCGYVNSFEFHRCRRTPGWNAYRFRFAPGHISAPDSKHSSFTAWTTGVSNPVRYPRFRASASVWSRVRCLRNRGSARYLSISPLHRAFRVLLSNSSPPVSTARGVSTGFYR